MVFAQGDVLSFNEVILVFTTLLLHTTHPPIGGPIDAGKKETKTYQYNYSYTQLKHIGYGSASLQ